MDLRTAILNTLNGNSVVIMGAGASYGAQNVYGDFPSGTRLAKDLYALCGITPDDENDLQDASTCYLDKFSATELISEIRSRLQCASFTDAHKEIYSLPWMRYYTTNYDDVALLAARNQDVKLTPITLNSPYRKFIDKKNLCIHINGHIGNLNEETLFTEFKLTSNSYYSYENISTSQWGNLLINDLDSAKSIIIIGLSLKYDLDLARLLHSSRCIAKTLIIDSPSLTTNAKNQLERFGSVYTLGIDGFAEEIRKTKITYTVEPKKPLERLYSGFIYEYHRKYEFVPRATPADVFNLFFTGRTSDSLFSVQNENYSGMLRRGLIEKALQYITDGKKIVFIHSDMGNGKTICIDQLRFELSKGDKHVFILSNPDHSLISEEIFDICSIKDKVIVIIDDYPSFPEIVKKFSNYSTSNIQFVLTARTALNHNKMPDVISSFAVEENQSTILDVNKLSSQEIGNCITMFDEFGLWGRKSSLNATEKREYLMKRNGGDRMFQSIVLDVLKSDVMIQKTNVLIATLRDTTTKYYDSIILILLVTAMGIRVTVTDIERIARLDISNDPLFKTNSAVNELISFEAETQFIVKSSVTSEYILQKLAEPELIILSLLKLAEYAVQYCEISKYFNILTSIISYSHINSFLHGFSNHKQFLLNYYDQISRIPYYSNNHFFWLQYAISCIEIREFTRAQQYLDTAYGLIPEKFVPFQINNQQARLYLEQILAEKSPNYFSDFKSAHKILMMPIVSDRDNEYNVIRIFGYYYRHGIQNKLNSAETQKVYKIYCKEAYERVIRFESRYSLYANDLKELKLKLLEICIGS